MATRLGLSRNLHKVFANFMIPDVASVNNAVIQVLNTLFTKYCTKVDPAGDCVVAPALPATNFKPGGRYVTEVIGNAYVGNEFGAIVRYPKTDLLVAKLKPNVVIPIVGFYVETASYETPTSQINIYRDVGKRDLWKSVLVALSYNILTWPRGYVAMLPEPLIVGPGGEIAIETEISSYFKTDNPYDIRVVVAWLPPVVFTSKSLFLTQPTTGP